MGNPYQFGTKSAEIEALQVALTAHKFDTKGTDGIFGKDTRDAVEAAQQFFNISPADGVPRDDLLSFLGIAAPPNPPASNPITDYLTQLAIKAVLANLKGLPMFDFLKGYKTYLVAAAMLLTGVADLAGGDIPGSGQFPALGWVFAGLLAFTGRSALKTLVQQIAALLGIDASKLPPAP